jgi:hypothetical protein
LVFRQAAAQPALFRQDESVYGGSGQPPGGPDEHFPLGGDFQRNRFPVTAQKAVGYGVFLHEITSFIKNGQSPDRPNTISISNSKPNVNGFLRFYVRSMCKSVFCTSIFSSVWLNFHLEKRDFP